ncbi:MAG: Clp protease ClpP [Bacteroidota bacterium]|nr:Clp protease ClpP [Bacteroidota bacterium]
MATKTIVIDGPIGQYSFSKQFIRNELSGQSKNPVLIKISSLGGSVDDALNIYDQFIEHGNVTAELSAFVASSATLISLGAKTVRMNENSFYLIHKAMNWVDEWGSMNEDEIDALIAKLETQKQQLAKVTLQLAKMYVKKTGKTLDEITGLMKQQTWLTAEEAKNWGFVDEVFVPEVAVNYLENLQMVAMINSSGYPEPPRKQLLKAPVPAVGELVEPVEAEATVAEHVEALFDRIWNRITNKQKEVTPINKTEMKTQFLNVNKVLTVDSLESTAEGVFLNETQLEAIENRLGLDQQIIEELDTANSARDAAIAERDTANTNLLNVMDPFNAIDATIASAETPEAKVLAIRALLAKKPATQPAGNMSKGDPVSDGVQWDVINNLEHNKKVDQNS